MVGIQPIRRHLDALSGPDRARTITVPLLRHTMLCHGVTLRSTLCSRPTAIPNLRSRLIETEERQRSHVGHSHSCDLRREGVSYAQIDQIFPIVVLYRSTATATTSHFNRVTNVPRCKGDIGCFVGRPWKPWTRKRCVVVTAYLLHTQTNRIPRKIPARGESPKMNTPDSDSSSKVADDFTWKRVCWRRRFGLGVNIR